MADVASIVGTRPEAIKMAPVLRALADRNVDQRLILTGQHVGLADHFAGIPRLHVHALSYRPSELSAGELCEAIEALADVELRRRPPRLVLVQGDTASAMAGARAAAGLGFAVGHVEAGLRSFDLADPWPEERYRRDIDALSTLLFAPTPLSAGNLERDGVGGSIIVTGNSGIDALFATRAARPVPRIDKSVRRLLVTCHRRENRKAKINSIAAALRAIAETMPVEIVFPLHPNPVIAAAFTARLKGLPNLELARPVDYPAMVALIDGCWAILTDSGGLQEEGAALGKPVLVLRDGTERPEASPNIAIVGHERDAIVAMVRRLLDDPNLYAQMSRPNTAFGTGAAGVRIADAIVAWLARQTRATALNGPSILA